MQKLMFTPGLVLVCVTMMATTLVQAATPLIGVNAVHLFWDRLDTGDSAVTYKAMKDAADAGFTLVRFAADPFCPSDMKDYWLDGDPEKTAEYWGHMDSVVADAEELGLSLLPSLSWHFMVFPALCNETWGHFWRSEASCGRSLLMKYTTEFVTRYASSRAIAGWEIGNEYNLLVDLDHGLNSVLSIKGPKWALYKGGGDDGDENENEHSGSSSRNSSSSSSLHAASARGDSGSELGWEPSCTSNLTSADNFSTADMVAGCSEWVSTVRLAEAGVQGSGQPKPLSSGFGAPRSQAYHLMQSYSSGQEDFTQDTENEFHQVLLLHNGPFDWASFHLYTPAGMDREWLPPDQDPLDPSPVFESAHSVTTGNLPESGLTFFAGEFGAPRNTSLPYPDWDQGRQYAFNGLSSLGRLNAPGLPWVWEFDQDPGDFSIWPGRDDELIAKMKEVNAHSSALP